MALAKLVKPMGVDVIDCSSGGILGKPPAGAAKPAYGYQVPYAEKIRKEGRIMTMAVGLIVHAEQAEGILQEGRADLVALAREMLYNPNWTMDAAQKLGCDAQFALVPPPYRYWLARRAATVPEVQAFDFRRRAERSRAAADQSMPVMPATAPARISHTGLRRVRNISATVASVSSDAAPVVIGRVREDPAAGERQPDRDRAQSAAYRAAQRRIGIVRVQARDRQGQQDRRDRSSPAWRRSRRPSRRAASPAASRTSCSGPGAAWPSA